MVVHVREVCSNWVVKHACVKIGEVCRRWDVCSRWDVSVQVDQVCTRGERWTLRRKGDVGYDVISAVALKGRFISLQARSTLLRGWRWHWGFTVSRHAGFVLKKSLKKCYQAV